MLPVGWEPPRVSLKEGQQEAGTGKLGEVWEQCGRWSPEEEPVGCLQTDLFFEALEGRKLAPEKRERKARTQTLEAGSPGFEA